MERTRDEKMAVANEILRQLGGHKFVVMTGARDILALDNGLRFGLPGGGGFCKKGINRVSVLLDPSDTYTVIFHKVKKVRGKFTGGYICETISEHTDVYNEQLQGIFAAETGLDTHL